MPKAETTKKRLRCPNKSISIKPRKAPAPAPRSHQVLTPDKDCKWLDSFMDTAIRGVKLVRTALKKKVITIPAISCPVAMSVRPIKQMMTDTTNK